MGQSRPLRCVGSGVPGDMYEHGHSIVPGTELQMFPRANRYSHRRRCIRCQSERYHFQRQDCRDKAKAWRREHASKMVKVGFANNRVEAADFMEQAGVTIDFLAGMFRDAPGKPCPGLCGWPERHFIKPGADNQGDWRDPRFPITRENVGPLCATCNQQKNGKPWAEFIARQHSIRINLESAVPSSPPDEQLGFAFG